MVSLPSVRLLVKVTTEVISGKRLMTQQSTHANVLCNWDGRYHPNYTEWNGRLNVPVFACVLCCVSEYTAEDAAECKYMCYTDLQV